MNIELTKEEADALLKLIDMAVRSGGLQVTEPALFFTRKITEAARVAEAAKVAESGPKLVEKDVA